MENKAAEYTGLNEVLQQPDGLGQYQEMVGQMQNPEALKEEALQQVQEYAFDHFAGKQDEPPADADALQQVRKRVAVALAHEEIAGIDRD